MPESIETSGVGEPWTCTSCGTFMYNLRWIDGRYVPVEGAPSPRFLSTEFPKVCQVCFELRTQITDLTGTTKEYWEKIAREDKKSAQEKKKLKSGENYLGT